MKLRGPLLLRKTAASLRYHAFRSLTLYDGSYNLSDPQSFNRRSPVTKSKRVTNSSGAVVSTIELDPWGAGTSRSINSAFQPRRFTSYTNDFDTGDDAMMRRYGSSWSRFSQPDPYDGSYDFSDPQSFNRYAYVQNDPVNFVDPRGLNLVAPGVSGGETHCVFVQGFVDDVKTLLSSHCMTIGGGSGPLGPGPGRRAGSGTAEAQDTSCRSEGAEQLY